MEKVTLTLPDGFKQRAHDHGLNVSKLCANAISEKVQKLENNESRTRPSKNRSELSRADTQNEAA